MRAPARGAVRCLMVMGILIGSLLPIVVAVPATATPAAPRAPAPATEAAGCPSESPKRPEEVPVLAHFYMWFQPSSWNRAKIDFPAVGRYSSSQTSVMQTQVAEARAAGIDGFIVGWRSTDILNPRLEALRSVAADNDFKLAITYQAQDFNRNPLPVAQV